jgi:bifunctional DNA-binding transcriptional regulator/antitoxin component of YhaV-PrlF toxin-antitoxin module
MVEIIFKGGIVQTGDRIKIPKPIIDTLDIKPGQKIILYFDPEKKEIRIKEEESKKK